MLTLSGFGLIIIKGIPSYHFSAFEKRFLSLIKWFHHLISAVKYSSK